MIARDLSAALLRALRRSAATAGVEAAIALERETPWESALFSGMRQEVAVTAGPCSALNAWLAGLGEVELAMAGCFVADLEAERGDEGARLCVLTLRE